VAIIAILFACNKFKTNDPEMDTPDMKAKAGAALAVECYQTLPSVISSNRTLSADSAYLINGVVRITSGATLTAPAGTVFFGQHAAGSKGFLIVERGAKLVCNGTATNPVVFTSFASAGSRAAGDWGGVVMLGKADNNVSGKVISIQKSGSAYSAGQASPINTDNSGTLTYVRIEYAGYKGTTDNYPAGLLMAAVGSGTTINNVQVNSSIKEGYSFLGGKLNAKNLASLDSYKNDFYFDLGYQGNLQFGLGMRKNINAHEGTTTSFSNGILIQNDDFGTTNTPRTHPVISNFSLVGPGYCTSSGLSTDFRNAILLTNNAEGNIYNSVVMGWPVRGVLFDDQATIDNAGINGTLTWRYNTFYGYTTAATRYDMGPGTSWPTTCVSSLTNFIINPTSAACASQGYQTLTSGSGFQASVCGNYCSAAPNFTLSGTSLLNSTYPSGSPVDIAFFDKGTRARGAFGTSGTAWASAAWTNYCPLSLNYCL